MKKYILLLLCIFLAFCKGSQYEFKTTELKIKRIEITQLPDLTLFYKCFVNGEAIAEDENCIKSTNISCNDQNFTIDDISLYTPNLDVYYITNYLSNTSILNYESSLNKIHSQYKIYKNDINSLSEIPIMNAEVINLQTYWKKCSNFFDNTFSFLQTLDDQYSYKLFIFFISKNTDENEIANRKYVENIQQVINKHPNWGFGIFYEKGFAEQIKNFNISIPDQCFFIKELIDVEYKGSQAQEKEINSAVSLMMNSNYKIDLRFDNEYIVDPNRETYEIILSSNYKNILLSDNYSWHPALSLIKEYYIQYVENSIAVYEEDENYPAMLGIIWDEYSKTKFPELKQLAVSKIREWLVSNVDLLENQSQSELLFQSGFDALYIADNVWELTSIWYLGLKEKFLVLYAAYQKNQNHNYNERIEIYNKILTINPDNKEMEFDLNECIADQYLDASNYPNALEYLQKAVDINNTSEIRTKLKTNLKRIITSDFQNRNYEELYYLAEKYNIYINDPKEDFRSITYWAIAARNIHKSDSALAKFNILLDNWHQNDVLDYDDLLKYMFNVYAENMDFEEAYELLKQVSMDIQEDELYKVPDLLWAIVYLRSVYLEPFINVVNRYFMNNGLHNIQPLAMEYADTDLSQYLENMYILNSNGNLKTNIYGLEGNIKLPTHLNRYTKKYIEDDITNWYIQPISNGYFVVQTSNNLTPSEEVWYRDLQNNFSEPAIWNEAKEFFTDESRITLIKLTSVIIGNDVVYNGVQNIPTYSQVLGEFPDYKYFVIQNSVEKIIYNLNFDTGDALYFNNGWESSSQSPLLYRQEIEYGFNKTKLLDIAYPYFKSGNWQGVIRYGFKE